MWQETGSMSVYTGLSSYKAAIVQSWGLYPVDLILPDHFPKVLSQNSIVALGFQPLRSININKTLGT